MAIEEEPVDNNILTQTFTIEQIEGPDRHPIKPPSPCESVCSRDVMLHNALTIALASYGGCRTAAGPFRPARGSDGITLLSNFNYGGLGETSPGDQDSLL
jgi:hypothetical protein